MAGNRSTSRRSGPPCWATIGAFSVGATFLLFLTSPISAQDARGYAVVAEAYSEEGENLTTPATPVRQFVWRVRNWMFHRDDEDVNIEVNATEATANPTDTEQNSNDARSWARSVAAWFARGIRHLLERLYSPEDGAGDGNSNGTEGVQTQDGGKPGDKPSKDGDVEDITIKPNTHIFRPWTALPPPPPPGMTADPDSSSSSASSSESTPIYNKPSIGGKTNSDSVGKSSTPGSKSTSDSPSSSSSPKKPKRRRPKPITTTTTMTPEIPTVPPVSTEVFIQDTGNEI